MDCQKSLFTLPDDHHYLNCAYFSPLLKSVEQAGIKGIREKRTPWTVTPDQFFSDSDKLRSQFARLANAEHPEEIAIMPSASYGLSTVAKNFDPGDGNEIVVVGEQFPSNIYPWTRFCKEHGCNLSIVESPGNDTDRGRIWNERILDAIGPDTMMIAIGHVHWTDGTLFDLESIGQKARHNDALFIIDGTQSVGALPFDVQKLKPDALICAGYKWLMGPYSIALGYFGKRFRNGIPLEEGWINRKSSEDFAELVNYEEQYQPGAIRYDVGERSNFILVPMMIKALEQLLEWSPGSIQNYCKKLTEGIDDKLRSFGYRIEDHTRRSHHLFGIRMPEGTDRKLLKEKLSSRNIHVAVRGSAIRISPNVYNDKSDIKALTGVLEEIG